MWKKLKERLIRWLGGYTREEYTAALNSRTKTRYREEPMLVHIVTAQGEFPLDMANSGIDMEGFIRQELMGRMGAELQKFVRVRMKEEPLNDTVWAKMTVRVVGSFPKEKEERDET